MDIISSVSNNLVKRIKLLRDDSKIRKQLGEYIVEGENLIDAIQNVSIIKELIVEKTKLDNFSNLINKIGCKNLYLVSSNVMEAMSDTKTPSGILAIVEIKQDLDFGKSNILVVADMIRDPGNLGTIMRTMAALNISDILCLNTVSPYSPKVVRSSMGGIFCLNIKEVNDSSYDLTDYRVLSLDMKGKNIYKELKIKKDEKIALVVGNEANGLSEKIKKQTTDFISLPMLGEIESLNAGVALSVALYQITFLLGGL